MKNLIALSVITYVCSSCAFAETYKNTNDQQNGKTFGQLMTWVLDGEKGPERVEIETSNQWQELRLIKLTMQYGWDMQLTSLTMVTLIFSLIQSFQNEHHPLALLAQKNDSSCYAA